MNWIDTGLIIAICTCASGLTQFLFWKHIAKTKSYESEIGKLNAQIEKIAQVTDTIKSVENKFIISTEQLKANLALSTNLHVNLELEKKDIIIDFNISLNKWINSSIYFAQIDLSNNDSIADSIKELDKQYHELLSKEIVFKIYIEDNALHVESNEIIKKGLDIAQQRNDLLFKIMNINDKIQKTNNKIELQSFHEERKNCLNDYLSNKQKEISNLNTYIYEFAVISRNYIYNILGHEP